MKAGLSFISSSHSVPGLSGESNVTWDCLSCPKSVDSQQGAIIGRERLAE